MTRGADPTSSLADALGVSEARLREAMDALRRTGRPQDLAAALADELGISEAEVRDALEAAMPQPGGPIGPGSGQAAPAPDDQAAPAPGTTRQS
jgi:DNA-binding Lrp family transcriptional regulator